MAPEGLDVLLLGGVGEHLSQVLNLFKEDVVFGPRPRSFKTLPPEGREIECHRTNPERHGIKALGELQRYHNCLGAAGHYGCRPP